MIFGQGIDEKADQGPHITDGHPPAGDEGNLLWIPQIGNGGVIKDKAGVIKELGNHEEEEDQSDGKGKAEEGTGQPVQRSHPHQKGADDGDQGEGQEINHLFPGAVHPDAEEGGEEDEEETGDGVGVTDEGTGQLIELFIPPHDLRHVKREEYGDDVGRENGIGRIVQGPGEDGKGEEEGEPCPGRFFMKFDHRRGVHEISPFRQQFSSK
ncbi:hypothetical protein CULT_170019 [[Clostridium] ultunense Esp]|nr:hypothetical protein CULT_170019 [[Clostridium] ultunense Esp]